MLACGFCCCCLCVCFSGKSLSERAIDDQVWSFVPAQIVIRLTNNEDKGLNRRCHEKHILKCLILSDHRAHSLDRAVVEWVHIQQVCSSANSVQWSAEGSVMGEWSPWQYANNKIYVSEWIPEMKRVKIVCLLIKIIRQSVSRAVCFKQVNYPSLQ